MASIKNSDTATYADDIEKLSLHMSKALKMLAATADDPIRHHLITLAAAAELNSVNAHIIGDLQS